MANVCSAGLDIGFASLDYLQIGFPGIVVASLSAFCAIWGLMKFLERFSTRPFLVDRAAPGVFLPLARSKGFLQ